MALTDIVVRKAKAQDKPYRLADEKGMYLEVALSGSKYWRWKYRFVGKEKRLALGVYPEVSLAAAREAQKASRVELAENSFEAVAREWFAKYARTWVASHADKILRRLERDIFPWVGGRPVDKVSAPVLLVCLRRIEARGAIETAHRALQNCGQVFRYAIATGRAERDPSADLRGALTPVVESHHASITDPKAIGNLLRAIAGYEGSLVTKCALRLAALVFVRPGELRKAEWVEFDLGKAEWRIPASRMKMREVHIVPLSTQASATMRELHALTGHGRYVFVFPGARTNGRPMSENTVNAALRRLGYAKDEMTGHGFRSMASTILNEQGWSRDAIERQLAHGETNNVRAAYNFAEYLPERRRMMQAWGDYLDALLVRHDAPASPNNPA